MVAVQMETGWGSWVENSKMRQRCSGCGFDFERHWTKSHPTSVPAFPSLTDSTTTTTMTLWEPYYFVAAAACKLGRELVAKKQELDWGITL